MTKGIESEYAPDLGTNPATVQMYDTYFDGASGAILKARIAQAAKDVDINPGLLAASMFAEFTRGSYTRQTGEVEGWLIGTDDYKERKADIERRVPSARKLKPIRYDPHRNENGRLIPEVPVFKAEDAVLASAVYLKYAEEEVRRVLRGMGGSIERLAIEHRFAITRYALNGGVGAMRLRVMEFLGMSGRPGHYVQNREGKEFLQYKHGKLKGGVEQFTRHRPQRAATAHAAQAIHISQKVFGINPAGLGDSLLFVR